MTPTKLLLVPAAAAALALPVPAATAASGGLKPGTAKKVCVTSTWIEKAPASHPIGVLYRSDTFRITRAGVVTVHHRDGSDERWVKGVGIHKDQKSGTTFRRAGWIRTAAFKGC